MSDTRRKLRLKIDSIWRMENDENIWKIKIIYCLKDHDNNNQWVGLKVGYKTPGYRGDGDLIVFDDYGHTICCDDRLDSVTGHYKTSGARLISSWR